MATARTREAARVIVLNENDQVLLLRYDEGEGVFWATPGGALEPGETHAQAARRELHEELGVQHISLGPQLATRAKEHLVHGEPVRQVERYFIASIPTAEVDLTQATQTDDILAWQWWSLPDIDQTQQTVYPLGLTTLIQRYLTDGAPASPAALQ